MIHINLLPHEAIDRPISRGKELGMAGGVLVIALAAITAAQVWQKTQLEALHAVAEGLEKQVASIRKQNQELTNLNIRGKKLQAQILTLGGLVNHPQKTASPRILQELSLRTPENLWLTEYTEHRGVAQIRGKSLDHGMIAAFAQSLSESRYLRSVEIRETQLDSTENTVHSRNTGASTAFPVATKTTTHFLIEATIEQAHGNTPITGEKG